MRSQTKASENLNTYQTQDSRASILSRENKPRGVKSLAKGGRSEIITLLCINVGRERERKRGIITRSKSAVSCSGSYLNVSYLLHLTSFSLERRARNWYWVGAALLIESVTRLIPKCQYMHKIMSVMQTGDTLRVIIYADCAKNSLAWRNASSDWVGKKSAHNRFTKAAATLGVAD